jgi:hypothetical protein
MSLRRCGRISHSLIISFHLNLKFSNSIARSLSDMALSSWADVVERVNGSFGVDLRPDAQPIQLGQLPPWAAYQKS